MRHQMKSLHFEMRHRMGLLSVSLRPYRSHPVARAEPCSHVMLPLEKGPAVSVPVVCDL